MMARLYWPGLAGLFASAIIVAGCGEAQTGAFPSVIRRSQE